MMLSSFGDVLKPSTLHEASAAFCRSLSVRSSASSSLHEDSTAERLRFEADLSICPPALVRPLGVLIAGAEDWTFSKAGLRGMLKSGAPRGGLRITSAPLKLPGSVSRVS